MIMDQWSEIDQVLITIEHKNEIYAEIIKFIDTYKLIHNHLIFKNLIHTQLKHYSFALISKNKFIDLSQLETLFNLHQHVFNCLKSQFIN